MVFVLCLLGVCGAGLGSEATALTGVNPERGTGVIHAYGGPACLTILGVYGADAKWVFLSGESPSRSPLRAFCRTTPENMIRWLQILSMSKVSGIRCGRHQAPFGRIRLDDRNRSERQRMVPNPSVLCETCVTQGRLREHPMTFLCSAR